jgi:hypothetical protein
LTEADIIQNQGRIVEAAKSFRQDANSIMQALAKDLNFSLGTNEFPREVYAHKYNNKGVFRNDWTYYFHGSECRFDNLQTGQIIELIYITRPEFGFLDGYFFYNYMVTTDKFKALADWFDGYLNVWKAIDLLADKGVLKRIPSELTNRNVIAL